METNLDLDAVRYLFASLANNCEKYGVQLNSVRFKRDNDTGHISDVLLSYTEPQGNTRTLIEHSQPIREAQADRNVHQTNIDG